MKELVPNKRFQKGVPDLVTHLVEGTLAEAIERTLRARPSDGGMLQGGSLSRYLTCSFASPPVAVEVEAEEEEKVVTLDDIPEKQDQVETTTTTTRPRSRHGRVKHQKKSRRVTHEEVVTVASRLGPRV